MKRIKHIVISLFLMTFLGSSQTTGLDSALNVLNTSNDDTIKVRTYGKISYLYLGKNDFSKSIEYSNGCLKLAEKLKYKRGLAMAYQYLGLAYEYKGDYEEAIGYDLKGLKIDEEINNVEHMASMTNNIGNVYFHQKNYVKAEEYWLKALSLKEKKPSESTLGNLALLYTFTGDYKKAVKYYAMALKINEEHGDQVGVADIHTNMGLVYYDMRDFKNALALHLKALEVFVRYKDKRRMNISYGNIGETYTKLGELEKAIEYMEKSLQLSNETGDKEGLRIAYEGLYAIYREKGEYKKAYQYHLLFSEITDTLFNEESNKLIVEMNTKYESEKKDKELLKKDAEIVTQNYEAKQQTIYIISSIAGFVFVLFLALFILKGYREKQRTNIAISEQKNIIELKNKEIVDSIHYAKRIQKALLAGDQLLKNNLNEHFVLYKPKDIVSGDFYWAHKIENKFLVCTADCTGHGVPGAFMSLLNISFLNEVTTEKKIIHPDKILNYVRESIILTLNSEGNEESQDGMDCTLCCFDLKNKKLEYAAANNSFYIIRDGKLMINPADKMPVGKSPNDNTPFTKQSVDLKSGDLIYTFTDGYADQFGGPKGKKFKYKALEELLLANHHLPMSQQNKVLEQTIESWRGSLEQVDDILIIGIKI